jgi:hypothetical protein
MAAVVDGPSALRAFLAALDVPQHEFSMVQLGFGDITAFAGFDDATARAMDDALEGAGVPPGHSGRIRRAVIKCRNTSTPQMRRRMELPLELLRQELSSVEHCLMESRHAAFTLNASRELLEAELVHERAKAVEKQTVLAAVKKQLGSVEKQRQAAQQAAQQAVNEAQKAIEATQQETRRAVEAAAEEARHTADLELVEMREQIDALQAAVAIEAACAEAQRALAKESDERSMAASLTQRAGTSAVARQPPSHEPVHVMCNESEC